MTVESATYISQLDSGLPAGTDAKSEGDNHIRLLKATIKATFPNVTAAVTADATELNKLDGLTATTAELNKLASSTMSAAELNYLTGVTSAIQTQLNAKAPLASPTFTGTVTVPSPFTLGATSMVATGAELNTLVGTGGSVSVTPFGISAPAVNKITSKLYAITGTFTNTSGSSISGNGSVKIFSFPGTIGVTTPLYIPVTVFGGTAQSYEGFVGIGQNGANAEAYLYLYNSSGVVSWANGDTLFINGVVPLS